MIKPTYDQHIIKPPERNKTHGRISDKLVIDSRERDMVKYPSPSKYRFYLNEEYKDVISVELVLARIPNSIYNITDDNNEMIFNINNNLIKFYIPKGEYTNESLIEVLNGSKGNIFEELVNNPEYDNMYLNFYWDEETNFIKIESNKEFTFNLNYTIKDKFIKCNQGDINLYYESIKYNSIDKTLGFQRKAHVAESKYDGRNCLSKIGKCDASQNVVPTMTIADVSGALVDEDVNGYPVYQITINENYDLRRIYNVGDYIEIGSPKHVYRVLKVLNPKVFWVEDIESTGALANGQTIYPYYAIYGTMSFEIQCPPYVILDIPQFHLIKANATSLDDAYAIIPLRHGCKTIVDSGAISLDKEIKFFNPPLARLDCFDVNFLNFENKHVDFNGKDHMLAFKVTTLNQPGKYNNFNETLF